MKVTKIEWENCNLKTNPYDSVRLGLAPLNQGVLESYENSVGLHTVCWWATTYLYTLRWWATYLNSVFLYYYCNFVTYIKNRI